MSQRKDNFNSNAFRDCKKLTCTFGSQIPITLIKESAGSGGVPGTVEEVMKCGFKIGGGIDQDYRKSPQGYSDNVCV